MYNANLKPSLVISELACIDPDAYAASTVVSAYVEAAKFNKLRAVIMAGTLGTGATLDAKLVQATNGAGANAKDIAGKAITQLTQAGTDSDKQAVIELDPSELDSAGLFTHVAISMTIGTATSDAGALLQGLFPTYAPPTDASSVDEIVA